HCMRARRGTPLLGSAFAPPSGRLVLMRTSQTRLLGFTTLRLVCSLRIRAAGTTAFVVLTSLLRNCANGVVALCASEENSTLTLPSPATAAGEGQNRSGGEDDRLESLSYIR